MIMRITQLQREVKTYYFECCPHEKGLCFTTSVIKSTNK